MYEYYYGTEAEQFNFIKIPRAFFTDKERFGTLSNEAKIMYSLLLDRMNLSMKNGWLDEHNRVYIIYTIDEIAETMGCGTNLAVRILKELDDENGVGLIHKKRRVFGLPTLIYVKKFFVGESSEKRKAEKSSECSKSEFISCENENSDVCKNNTLECSKGECNYTYPNKTDMSYTDNQSFTPACERKFSAFENFGMIEKIDRAEIEETVKSNIDYDCLMSNDDESVRGMVEEIKEIIVDVLSGERSVYVGGKKISDEAASAAFGRLTSEHIMSALHNILNNPNQISQIDKYIAAVLYNASHTFNLSTFSGFTANTGLKMIKKLIGFTPEEWEVICKKAKVARLRTGTYIRRMSVKGEIKYYELKELVTLKRAFLSIGNNLNQIAKVANESGTVTQKDIEDLQEEFKYFRTAMQNYLFEISPTFIS